MKKKTKKFIKALSKKQRKLLKDNIESIDFYMHNKCPLGFLFGSYSNWKSEIFMKKLFKNPYKPSRTVSHIERKWYKKPKKAIKLFKKYL